MTEARPNKKRLTFAKNSLLGVLSWGLALVPSLIATPLIVRQIGTESYGLYVTLIGITSYFFTHGTGRTATKYIAEYRGTPKSRRIGQAVAASLFVSVISTLVGVVILSLSASWVVRDVLKLPDGQQATGITGIYLAGIIILGSAGAQTWQFVLQGFNRFATVLWISNSISFLLSVGSLVLALLGFDVLGLLFWAAVTTAISLSLSMVQALTIPEVRLTFRISRSMWRQVWGYAASIMGYQLFGIVLLLFERAWVVRHFGPTGMTYYGIPMNLALLIPAFLGGVVLAVFPALNEHLHRDDVVAEIYRRSSKFVLMLIVLVAVAAIGTGRLFLGLWLNANIANEAYPLLAAHVISFSITAHLLVTWSLVEARKAAPITAFINFIIALVAIIAMVVLTERFGLLGVALGRLLGYLLYLPFWIYAERRFLGHFQILFWLSNCWRLLIAAAAAALVQILVSGALGGTWSSWILSVLAGVAAYAAMLLLTGYFDAEEKLLFRSLLTRSLGNARL
jgi:O-antigen/teichoic acid export membrane protein